MSLTAISPFSIAASPISREELESLLRGQKGQAFIFFVVGECSTLAQSLEALVGDLAEHRAQSRVIAASELGRLIFDPPMTLVALIFPGGKWSKVSRALAEVWGRYFSPNGKRPSWEQFGALVPVPEVRKKVKPNPDLACFSFQHHPGVFYRFRYRRSRISKIPNILAEFLTKIPEVCPHDVFTSPTNARASAQELPHRIEALVGVTESILRHAVESVDYVPYKTRHENLERYFLEYDEDAVATEVPVWSLGEDHRFPSLTGHIDVLRVVAGRIEVWDYKPKAREEKMAALQVQLYCEMLARRTGLPLDNFLAGYFDETDAYAFKPGAFVYL